MSLDHAVSRAIMKARLLECALHSDDNWSITIGDTTVKANRAVLDDRVVFSALFGERPVGDIQTLDHAGVSLSARRISVPDLDRFIVDWELLIREEDAVAA
jgi:hypothetical protein